MERPLLEKMARTLVHRGPDDEGYLVRGPLGFGFRRLSIIDLATGHQPMSNEDGNVHLICNGEIFNYKELRRELIARGHRFRSDADVEVLVHLYEEEGEAMLERLNGQFAFAVFDETEQRLLLARDQVGILPLFYTVAGGALIFASEIKAILAHPEVERRVDLTALDQLLSLPAPISPRTMFAGISSLPPGHLLRAAGGRVETREYWDFVYPRHDEAVYDRPEEDYAEELRVRLVESIRYRLQADVPVGIYLSGGLDSSLIAGMVARETDERPTTFSVDFRDAAFTEGRFQRLVSERVGFPHHEIEFGAEEVAERLRRVVRHAECPLKESYDTASLALSAAVRASGVKVILNGEGADELFAGYMSYRFDAFRSAGGPGTELTPEAADLQRRLWGDGAFLYERNQHDFIAVKRSLYSPELAAGYDDFAFHREPVVCPGRLAGLHPLHRRSYLDFKLRLAHHLLSDHGDRMTLAYSNEGRYPFLDVGVLDAVRRVPPDLKLNGFKEKYLLKKVAEAYVPREIIAREKFAFSSPGTPFLLGTRTQWIEDLLSPETVRRQGYFDVGEVERLKEKYRALGFRLSVPYDDDLLMVVLTFGIFCEEFGLPGL